MTGAAREFRIGLIGCGRISQAYVDAIAVCEGTKLAAVMDTRLEVARAAAEASDAAVYTDLEAFVANSGVNGAIICAPPAHHKEIACVLMQSGIHVLCEKPFATRIEDATAMLETANRSAIVLMMASKFLRDLDRESTAKRFTINFFRSSR